MLTQTRTTRRSSLHMPNEFASASGLDAVIKLGEEILDFARTEIGLRIIERHRTMQAALRRLEPAARFLEAAEKMHGVAEQARETHHLARFVRREATRRLPFLNRRAGKPEPDRQLFERKIQLPAQSLEFTKSVTRW